jgi:type I restriction enzyme S subunit
MGGDLLNGDVPARWEFTTLGEVCRRGGGNIQTGPFGSQLHASDYVPVGVPSIMPTNIGHNRIIEEGIVRITEDDANRLNQHRVKPGDIVYSRRGDVEKRALIRETESGWLCGTGCLKMRLGAGVVDPVYASFFLGHPTIRERIVRHAIGATMPNLDTSIMSAVPFALPPMDEQRAIAYILGTLDDKIELNRRTNETLEAMARALFKSWFVDFDPVRAKAQGQTPPGMEAATAALFPSEFQDSELGEIPEGWRIAPLKDWVDALSGGTPSKMNAAYWGGDIPWISPKVMTAIHADRAERYVTEAAIGNGTRLAPAGAMLVMVRGMGLHQEVRVSQALRDVTFNQDVKALVATGIEPTLLLFALLDAQQVLLGRVESSGHGTGRLPSDVLLSYPLVMPELGTQEALARPFSDINRHIALLRAESQTLARTRDALLPRLLSGELSVAQAEQAVEVTA